jgi:Na+/alanine symporter
MQRFRPLALLVLVAAALFWSAAPIEASVHAVQEAADAAEVTQEAAPSAPETAPAEESLFESIERRADSQVGELNRYVGAVLFLDLWPFDNEPGWFLGGRDLKGDVFVPFTVAWLVLGAIFFTLRMGFVNLRGFKHAVAVVSGKFTDKNEKRDGEVSHFQALSAALSATVGLGNIAGVATAITIGGPGATVWLIVAGFLGMTSKMVECSLGQMYKERRRDGSVMGGAMQYLSKGLAEKGLGKLGMVLAVLFTVMCIGGSFGGGNSYQVNQSLAAIIAMSPDPEHSWLANNRWVYGLGMTIATGIVIIGGIKRIAQVAEKIVPLMCGAYILTCTAIILVNVDNVAHAFGAMLNGAFTGEGILGGVIGVMIVGFQRAAFSNEAGLSGARGHRGAARALHRHGRRLHHDRTRHRDDGRLRESRVRDEDR